MSEVMRLLSRFGASGVRDRVPESQALDALGRPVRLDVGRRHPPDLLGVGLEESPVQAPAESPRRPALERAEVLRRVHTDPEKRKAAPDRLHQPEARERVVEPDRVVEVGPVVVDPAQPGPDEEVLRTEDLVPQVLDLRHLREEAVPPEVEPPSLPLHGAGDPADDSVHLEDRARSAPLRELVRGGQSRRACSHHDDRAGAVAVLSEAAGLPAELVTVLTGAAASVPAEPVSARLARGHPHGAIIPRRLADLVGRRVAARRLTAHTHRGRRESRT